MPNYQGKRRRSTEGAQGTNTGHENAEGMACVGVRLTGQLGNGLALGLYCQKLTLGTPNFKGFAPHMLQIGKRNELPAICLAGELFSQWRRKRW